MFGSVAICVFVILVVLVLAGGCYWMWGPSSSTDKLSRCKPGGNNSVNITVEDGSNPSTDNNIQTVRLTSRSSEPYHPASNNKKTDVLGSMSVTDRKERYKKATMNYWQFEVLRDNDRDPSNNYYPAETRSIRDTLNCDPQLQRIRSQQKKSLEERFSNCPGPNIPTNPNMNFGDN